MLVSPSVTGSAMRSPQRKRMLSTTLTWWFSTRCNASSPFRAAGKRSSRPRHGGAQVKKHLVLAQRANKRREHHTAQIEIAPTGEAP